MCKEHPWACCRGLTASICNFHPCLLQAWWFLQMAPNPFPLSELSVHCLIPPSKGSGSPVGTPCDVDGGLQGSGVIAPLWPQFPRV